MSEWKLAAILYRRDRSYFDKKEAQIRAKQFEELPESILNSIEFIFQNLQEIIINMPEIGILYKRKGKKEKGISIGVTDTLYNLSHEGYGSLKDLGQELLEDYLKLMLKRLKDYVEQLRSMENDNFEIAKKTGLDPSIVNQI